jgi:hypothetical protein
MSHILDACAVVSMPALAITAVPVHSCCVACYCVCPVAATLDAAIPLCRLPMWTLLSLPAASYPPPQLSILMMRPLPHSCWQA